MKFFKLSLFYSLEYTASERRAGEVLMSRDAHIRRYTVQ